MLHCIYYHNSDFIELYHFPKHLQGNWKEIPSNKQKNKRPQYYPITGSNLLIHINIICIVSCLLLWREAWGKSLNMWESFNLGKKQLQKACEEPKSSLKYRSALHCRCRSFFTKPVMWLNLHKSQCTFVEGFHLVS